MLDITFIQKICLWALPVLFAITVHEVAHGWVASKFGDQTARLTGRLTLNPIKHIDLVGTVLVPILLLLFTNFVFGWAKPVPVDARNMRNPKTDMAIVAAAGPISNLLMALFWGAIVKIGILIAPENAWLGRPLVGMGEAGIMVNAVLCVLNLIPLPPLDGGRVLVNLLPGRMSWSFSRIEPYGFLILILLMMTNILSIIMTPFIYMIIDGITQLFRIA